MIYEEIFGIISFPSNNPAVNFPSPFLDLQYYSSDDIEAFANILSYLEFSNGIPVVLRDMPYFSGAQFVSKGEAIKACIEA